MTDAELNNEIKKLNSKIEHNKERANQTFNDEYTRLLQTLSTKKSELLDNYYDELKEYTDNLISNSIDGITDLSLLKRVLVRQKNEELNYYSYYHAFIFDTKNTWSHVLNASWPASMKFEKERENLGDILITVLVPTSANCDTVGSGYDFLTAPDKIMLTFAFFYRQNNNVEESLEKTKKIFERIKIEEWFYRKRKFVEFLLDA